MPQAPLSPELIAQLRALMPTPGDTPQVAAQKQAALQQAITSMGGPGAGGGPGARVGLQPGAPTPFNLPGPTPGPAPGLFGGGLSGGAGATGSFTGAPPSGRATSGGLGQLIAPGGAAGTPSGRPPTMVPTGPAPSAAAPRPPFTPSQGRAQKPLTLAGPANVPGAPAPMPARGPLADGRSVPSTIGRATPLASPLPPAAAAPPAAGGASLNFSDYLMPDEAKQINFSTHGIMGDRDRLPIQWGTAGADPAAPDPELDAIVAESRALSQGVGQAAGRRAAASRTLPVGTPGDVGLATQVGTPAGLGEPPPPASSGRGFLGTGATEQIAKALGAPAAGALTPENQSYLDAAMSRQGLESLLDTSSSAEPAEAPAPAESAAVSLPSLDLTALFGRALPSPLDTAATGGGMPGVASPLILELIRQTRGQTALPALSNVDSFRRPGRGRVFGGS